MKRKDPKKRRSGMWVLLCIGWALFAAAGALLWLEDQGRFSEWSAALAAGCLVSGAFALIMAGAEYVTRD